MLADHPRHPATKFSEAQTEPTIAVGFQFLPLKREFSYEIMIMIYKIYKTTIHASMQAHF